MGDMERIGVEKTGRKGGQLSIMEYWMGLANGWESRQEGGWVD